MRKFLSLLLALIMTMSLVTISAGAADFTDESDINYDEAIDVISAIGVVDGYSDGSFKPTTVLTRGAAAKIICNMILGPTASASLTASVAPFKDVPANHTFAAQIAYCAQQKIINGYSDGTFQPGGTLTGYAFLKMLEGALGYDGTVEGFTGSNWTINVAKIANGIGLLEGVAEGFSGTSAVDRQTACLFAFNTLKADLVEYDSKITATVGGVDVTIGGSNGAKSVTAETQASNTNNWNIVNESRDHDQDSQGATSWRDNFAIVQFGERYFPRLVRNNGEYKWNNRWNGAYTTDALGRPSSTWTYRGEKIGTYTEAPIKTYEGNVSITDIYNDLEMNTATNGSFNGNGVVFVNGVNYSGLTYDKTAKEITALGDGTVKIERNSKLKTNDLTAGFDMAMLLGLDASDSDGFRPKPLTAAQLQDIDDGIIDGATDKKIGNGTKTEVYRNDATNDVIIAIISIYGGKVTSVNEGTAKRDDYIEIEYGALDVHAPVGMDDNHNWFETTGLKEDDVVAYTYSNKTNGIQSMEKIESVEGSLAKRTVGKDLTLGDTTYKYAQEYNFEYGLDETGLTNKSNYRVFLDEFGYALWIEEAAFNAKEYALIERITSEVNGSRSDVVSHTLDDMTGNYNNTQNQDARVPQKYASTSTSLDWTTNRVQLLFADGSERTVNLDRSYYTSEKTSRNVWEKSTGRLKDLENSTGSNLEFWAGDVVRVTELSSGSVRLNRIGQTKIATYAGNRDVRNTFLSMIGGKTDTTPAPAHDETKGFATIMNRNLKFNGVDVYTDSNTIFVVKVDNGRNSYDWKVYTGIKNAPTVELGVGFAYMRGGVAKIVYITDGDVKNVSRDVTFITGASVSKLRTETDGRQYYTYDAVVRGEVTTIMIDAEIESKFEKDGVTPMHASVRGQNFVIGEGTDAEDGKVMIINNYISDTDDVITKLEYASNEVTADYAQGIKKISGSTGEIKVGANGTTYGRTLTLASNVKVFLADNGGGIEAVDLDDIKTSKTNFVYWTLDDGLVTNLFVIEVPDRD